MVLFCDTYVDSVAGYLHLTLGAPARREVDAKMQK